MFTRPTTDRLLRSIVDELRREIGPDLQGEPAKVALQMIEQLLLGCAERAAHEIAWMHEEGAVIDAAVAGIDDAATQQALSAYRDADASLHLDAVIARYSCAGDALAAAIEHAYRIGDTSLATSLRELLKARSATEMAIVGSLDLVGRG